MHRYHTTLLFLVCATLSITAAGCGGGSWSYPLVGTQRDPGAEGTVQIERIEGGNRLVTVSLRHVTPPERLGTELTAFVLWFRDDRGHSTKASALEYDPGSRTARATATTPLPSFSLVVTAERDNTVLEPSENVLFSQDVTTD